jgi:hypothetical protein
MIDRGKRTESRIRPSVRSDLNSTQELYYFIDNIRYKAQLLENQVNSMTGEAEHKAKSAQAASNGISHLCLMMKNIIKLSHTFCIT